MRSGVGGKSTFLSTRVEEPVGETSDTSIDHDEEGQQTEEDIVDESISDEELDTPTVSVKPYNSLLQSLVVDMLPGQPQRKRRRIDIAETANAVKSPEVVFAENDLEPVDEPDKDDLLKPEDIEDTDEETDNKEGRFYTMSTGT